MKDEHPLPPRGEAVYSDEQTGEPGAGVAGPVVSEFTVAHPFGEQGRFATTVRLYRRPPPRSRSARACSTTTSSSATASSSPPPSPTGRRVHEIPFGAIARPDGIEFPAQNWVDWSDGARGLALLNRGLPGNAVNGGALLLSLLRSTRIVAYGFGGGYGPGMSSDTGLELGKELVFDYALVPHEGDWQAARALPRGPGVQHPAHRPHRRPARRRRCPPAGASCR